MQVGELEREYIVHSPTGYSTRKPARLLLAFHGYTGTAALIEDYSRLSRDADRNGFVVVYPQGTGFIAESGQNMTSWNDLAGNASPGPDGPICSETADKYPSPPECGEPTACNWASCHDDVGFVGALLDRLEETLCIDRDRVYATGASNGGMFVHRLGCDMAERFAAIAPVAGTLARGFNCAPAAPLAMMNIYGTGDLYVSQRGDMSSDGYFYLKAEDVLGKWAEASSQDCDAATTPYPTSGDGILGLACIQHDNCASGAEVVHCTWDGAHDWPQSKTSDVGNEVMWEFFEKHSRSRGQ
jgi:polyhydroxybutyrate depolymerase